jgi:hypothetical protein
MFQNQAGGHQDRCGFRPPARRRHWSVKPQVSVTVSVVQPSVPGTLHERVKLAELLPAAVLEHDGLAHPAALKLE